MVAPSEVATGTMATATRPAITRIHASRVRPGCFTMAARHQLRPSSKRTVLEYSANRGNDPAVRRTIDVSGSGTAP
jgi:hypothetical protein